MKYQIYFLLFTVFLTCNDSKESLFGEYRTSKPNKLEQSFNRLVNGQLNIIGSELILEKDSSFSYLTCGNIFKGKWKSKKDTLLLFVETNKWANDSLSQYGFYGEKPKIGKNPFKFEIINNGFKGKSLIEIEGKSFIIVEELKKVEN